MNFSLTDHKNTLIHLNARYIRYGNRILDASSISLIRAKKSKLLFNSFKQNTTLPTLAITFKTDAEAQDALTKCCELYDYCGSNSYYSEEDTLTDVNLPDAFGTTLHVNPNFIEYRNRVLNTTDVMSVSVKGRKILVNHYKGNSSLPTLCVYFKTKGDVMHAFNSIHSILWNIDVSEEVFSPLKENTSSLSEDMLRIMEEPADPIFFKFFAAGTMILLFLNLLRAGLTSEGYSNDEL